MEGTPEDRLMTILPERSRRWLRRKAAAFNSIVDTRDAEILLNALKWVYYPTFVLAGLYSWFVANEQTRSIRETLGPFTLGGFIALNILMPVIALTGAQMTKRAATKAPGEPNSAAGGAWFQLWGDGGVFAAIVIALLAFIATFQWGQAMYYTFFFLMGVPGGFLFTYRSWRRVRMIKVRSRLQRGRP